MSSIHIIAEMKVDPDNRAELLSHLQNLVKKSRAEAGNISYDLMEDLDDPSHLFIMENWQSQAAIEAHNASPHFKEFQKLAADKRKDARATLLKKIF